MSVQCAFVYSSFSSIQQAKAWWSWPRLSPVVATLRPCHGPVPSPVVAPAWPNRGPVVAPSQPRRCPVAAPLRPHCGPIAAQSRSVVVSRCNSFFASTLTSKLCTVQPYQTLDRTGLDFVLCLYKHWIQEMTPQMRRTVGPLQLCFSPTQKPTLKII